MLFLLFGFYIILSLYLFLISVCNCFDMDTNRLLLVYYIILYLFLTMVRNSLFLNLFLLHTIYMIPKIYYTNSAISIILYLTKNIFAVFGKKKHETCAVRMPTPLHVFFWLGKRKKN